MNTTQLLFLSFDKFIVPKLMIHIFLSSNIRYYIIIVICLRKMIKGLKYNYYQLQREQNIKRITRAVSICAIILNKIAMIRRSGFSSEFFY